VADLSAVRPIETSSLVQQVTVGICRSIIAGRLQPGREFSLRGIATQLNVSRIPVREALRSLEEQGLIFRMAFGARDARPHEHSRRRHVHEELVDVCEAGDRVAVEVAVRAHLDTNEHLARHAVAPILS
jgi:DNA-binding GntR family transcriptional regulator